MIKIKDTLYAKYMKERSNAEILETESGFIVYRIVGKECFIVDMYFDRDKRGTKLPTQLVNELGEVAKESGCECITANIHLSDKMAAKTLTSTLKFGFSLVRADAGILLIAKDLRGN